MRKLILILAVTAMLAFSGAAFAVDAPELDQSVIKLIIYNKDCAPLSAKLHDMVVDMLRAMDERERVRAVMVVSQITVGHHDEFCKAMELGVKQLEKKEAE